MALTVEEYKQQREQLDLYYGDPDDPPEKLAAKRDQAFAELFYRSGWTQQQLAEVEGKTQGWVQLRLRLGRFLAYAADNTAVLTGSQRPLTEWHFRGLWQQTEADSEEARFAAVVALMREPPKPPEPKPFAPPNQWLESAKSEDLDEQEESRPPKQDKAERGAERKAEREAEREARLRSQMEIEIQDRVTARVREHIKNVLEPMYNRQLTEADERLAKYRPPLTPDEYNTLVWATHEDQTDPPRRAAAFDILRRLRVVLRGPDKEDQPPRRMPGNLIDMSLGEMLARKKPIERPRVERDAA